MKTKSGLARVAWKNMHFISITHTRTGKRKIQLSAADNATFLQAIKVSKIVSAFLKQMSFFVYSFWFPQQEECSITAIVGMIIVGNGRQVQIVLMPSDIYPIPLLSCLFLFDLWWSELANVSHNHQMIMPMSALKLFPNFCTCIDWKRFTIVPLTPPVEVRKTCLDFPSLSLFMWNLICFHEFPCTQRERSRSLTRRGLREGEGRPLTAIPRSHHSHKWRISVHG